MRASKVGLFGIVAGAAVYALRAAGVPSRLRERLEGGSRARSSGEDQVSTASQAGRTSQVWPDVADEFEADPDRVLAERERQADRPVDATADSSDLVAAERDALTVPGEDGADHRRRDQTAGEAAQEIAAAQVRERRFLHGDHDYD